MNWRRPFASIVVLALAAIAASGQAHAQAPLHLIATIPLANVAGRIDHLAFDAARQRLWISALGNDTVEVIDLATGARIKSIAGFHEPQGIVAVPDQKAVAVANGASGTLQLVDAETFQSRWTVEAGGDADNVRYDASARRIYVAAQGGLVGVDPASGRLLQRVAITGHPESFQLESQGARVFVNLPGASQIVAANRNTGAATAHWPTGACQANYPMALDESTGRAFVGCRRPASVAMVDTATGQTVGSAAAVGDTDDVFYDSGRQRLYVIGGEGFIDVLQREGDRLRSIGRVATRSGARTGLWVAEQNRLYVAVPARGGQPTEVRVFEPR